MRLEDIHQGVKVMATLNGVTQTKYYSLRKLVFKEA